jgi:hypothetical protein
MLPIAGHLCLQGILRGKKPAEASDQPSDGFHVQAVGPAEGVQDIGPCVPTSGIPDVVGELDIGSGCTVLVLAGDGSDVHASSNSIYYSLHKVLNAIAHAYSYFDFQKAKPTCFLNPLLKYTPKYAYDCRTRENDESITGEKMTEWTESKNPSTKQQIFDYNEDDCRAMSVLLDVYNVLLKQICLLLVFKDIR